jgi:glycosyltransferase involved in cell wall biosynthesis
LEAELKDFDIYVVSCGFRSSRFAVECIKSVQRQTFAPKTHFYIDDASDDDTQDHLRSLPIPSEEMKCPLEISLNANRYYKLQNLYSFMNLFPMNDDDVVCVLDGDDWIDDDAIEKVRREYNDPYVQYVYTNWRYSHNGEAGISRRIPSNDWNPYTSPWITSAMSTFRAGLWHSVNPANFVGHDGKFFRMACDQAYILPMLRYLQYMDGDYRAVRFIDEPLYVYQFLENPSKPRYGNYGDEMTNMSHNCGEFIRKRGYIE